MYTVSSATAVVDWWLQTVSDMVVWAAFHPHDCTTIITFGRQHISFWKLFWDESRPGAGSTGRLLRDKQSGAFDVRTSLSLLSAAVSQTNTRPGSSNRAA